MLWPLSEVLNLEPAWGGDTWAEVLDFALSEPLDVAVIEALCTDLIRDGRFREPVRIEDYSDDGHLSLGNGMHRIIAHILCGVEPVLVSDREQEAPFCWRARFGVPDETAEQVFDLSWGLSFPVLDGWLERMSCARIDGFVEVDLCSATDLPTPEVERLVLGYFGALGVAVEVDQLEVLTLLWDGDSEEFVESPTVESLV